jgi:hypothetical protein
VRAKFKNVERSVCGNIFMFGRYSCWAQNFVYAGIYCRESEIGSFAALLSWCLKSICNRFQSRVGFVSVSHPGREGSKPNEFRARRHGSCLHGMPYRSRMTLRRCLTEECRIKRGTKGKPTACAR